MTDKPEQPTIADIVTDLNELGFQDTAAMIESQADRIAELEGALRRISTANWLDPDKFEDETSFCIWARTIARAALTPKEKT